jgi:tyrocidine synthetase-3
LGEIENRLLKHPGIKEAVVLLHEEAKGDKYICAYAVSADENVTVGLREFLTKELPDYMIPAHFVRLEKVPLTPNGKIDRRALPKPEIKIGETYTAPRNDVENKLEELWSEVLGLEKEVIGIDSDFFQLGGHSLKATSLIAKIHKLFGVKVPLAELFKTPRIRELAGYINAAASREYKQIELAEKKEYYTLSSAQKRLYLLQQMDKDSTAYNIPLVLRLVGIVDKNKLEQSIRGLIRRHESLRTSFIIVDEKPVQRIHDEVDFEIEYLATDGLGQTRTFDLSKAPLLRVGLGIIEEEKHLFRVDMHHIISDGVSSRVLVQDFSTLYAGEEAPEIKLQYKDYAEWQNRERVSNKIQQQGEYWEKEFFGEIPVLELPADVARPPVQAFEGSSIIFKIEKEICEELKTLAQEAGATLYIVLLMLYNIFLAKLCSREDIVIGSPVAGRKHADLEKIIGMFVNTLALRNYPSGEKRVINFLGEVKERTLEALENQEYQYEDLVENVAVTRDVSRNPLFDTMFALQNFKLEKIAIPGLKLIPCEIENKTSKFDLTLTGMEKEEGLEFTFEYSTKLFKRTTIERFIIYFKNIIVGVLQDSGIRISEVEILALEEKNFILFELNESEKEYPKDKTIHQLFMEQVSKTPDCVGLVGIVGLSYRKINEQTDQLAGSLLETGILPDYIVGIMMERSLEQIIGILSILKAGGAYLPIDPELPQNRIEYMLKDSGAKLLVNEKFFRGSRALRRGEPIRVFQKCPPGVANLAYVIYTSGSTGKPKGVMVEHRSLVNLCWWHKMFYSITSRDRTTRYAGFGFDASVWEIFPYLISGASLYIVPEQLILDIRALNVYYEKNDITIGFLPTQVCEQFMAFDNKSLRVLLTGGDKLRNYIQRSYRLYNNYGPTENTVVTTSFCVTGEFANIPIGKPVFNNQIYIVDRYQRLQPIGVPGEILVGGDGLARGYLNNPELTAEKFIKYRSYRTNRTYINYKTGDLARWLDSGNIEFLGRIDLQVKIRGFRIELGEIESRLSKYPGIKEALVLVQEEVSGDKYLCGYVVSDREYKISELREFLSKELPDYMIPSHWMQLEKIPLTPNGKVDRNALAKPELKTGEGYTAPRNEIEKKLAELWAEILGHASIGIDDNFFQLGGHSLKAAILAAKIHKVFDVIVPLAEIFKTPRIDELAKYIKDKSRQLYTGIEPVEKMEYYALSSAQMRLYVQQKMNPDSIAYNMPVIIPLPVGADWRKIEEAFKKLIKRHEILRTSFHMVNGTPVQKVNEHVEFEIEYLTTDEYGQTRTFDLSKAPLLRVALWKMEQELILMVDMHHIISDGASMEIVIDDFIRFYQGENLTALNVQYKDYAAWQDKRLTEETLQSQEKYWLNQLQDFVFTRFPYDYLDSHDLIKGATLYEEIGTALYDKIERFCNEHHVTRFVFLITVFELALARNIDQWDITLGIPSSIRDHPDLKDLIGIFLNVLLIRTVIDYTEPFINCLARNKDTVIDALNNQDYPYEMLNDIMRAVSPSKENELFSILFNYSPLELDKKSATTDFEIKPMETPEISPKYDMTLYVSDGNGRIMLSMVYKSNIYNKDSIGRILSDFLEMLQRVLADSNIPISQLTTWDGDNGEELELDREIETYYNEGEF